MLFINLVVYRYMAFFRFKIYNISCDNDYTFYFSATLQTVLLQNEIYHNFIIYVQQLAKMA